MSSGVCWCCRSSFESFTKRPEMKGQMMLEQRLSCATAGAERKHLCPFLGFGFSLWYILCRLATLLLLCSYCCLYCAWWIRGDDSIPYVHRDTRLMSERRWWSRGKLHYETGECDSERLSNSSFVDPYTNVFCDYLFTLSCSVPFSDSACSGFRIHARNETFTLDWLSWFLPKWMPHEIWNLGHIRCERSDGRAWAAIEALKCSRWFSVFMIKEKFSSLNPLFPCRPSKSHLVSSPTTFVSQISSFKLFLKIIRCHLTRRSIYVNADCKILIAIWKARKKHFESRQKRVENALDYQAIKHEAGNFYFRCSLQLFLE